MADSGELELVLRLLFSGVIPAKAGIQHAAAAPGLLDRLPFAAMTRLVGSIKNEIRSSPA
jgi:hypothetical protein